MTENNRDEALKLQNISQKSEGALYRFQPGQGWILISRPGYAAENPITSAGPHALEGEYKLVLAQEDTQLNNQCFVAPTQQSGTAQNPYDPDHPEYNITNHTGDYFCRSGWYAEEDSAVSDSISCISIGSPEFARPHLDPRESASSTHDTAAVSYNEYQTDACGDNLEDVTSRSLLNTVISPQESNLRQSQQYFDDFEKGYEVYESCPRDSTLVPDVEICWDKVFEERDSWPEVVLVD